MKEKVFYIVFVYLVASTVLWVLRLSYGGDCEHRYIDFVFPITKLHCQVEEHPFAVKDALVTPTDEPSVK